MNRPARYILGAFVAVILLAGAFSGGLIVGWIIPGESPNLLSPFTGAPALAPEANNGDPAASSPQDLEALFAPFWETYRLVNAQYVDQPIDQELLMRGAIRGMLDSLGDPHTGYMDPQEFRQANLPMDGEYEGIGAWVDTTGDFLKIVSPMPGSPAEEAGLAPGDTIIKVDGEDMAGVDGKLVLQRVLGPAGTSVVLTIQREGQEEPFEVSIRRAKIDVPSVESKILEGDIAYVRVFTFGEKTTAEVKAALKEVMKEKPKGLILDLRNNGGGYLTTTVDVVSQFISDGVVMYEIYGDGQRKTFDAKPGGLATDVPLVVLVNGGTASASEITAGAIQDYERGIVVGETTYGKGSVQQWIPLDNDQGAVRVTVARWVTPKERQIHGVGLEPDVVVALTEEDAANGKDPQLDKAVEILKGGQ
jgi:carboxyl-terminal processing protease